MILITGGAGFIGSNLHAELARRGHETVVADSLGNRGKWRNLAKHPPTRVVHPDELETFLSGRPAVEMVFHLGAVSETTAVDGDQYLGDERRTQPQPVGMVCGSRGANGVRVLRGDVRRRIGRLRR